MKKNKKSYLPVVLGLVLVILIGTAATLFIFGNKQKKAAAQTNTQAAENVQDTQTAESRVTWQGKEYQYNTDLKTILFLGVDKKEEVKVQENVGRGGQSDCLILLVMNTKDKTTKLVEISRDTMTDIDIYGISGDYLSTQTAQIATQYAYGDGEKRSCQLSKKAVGNLVYGVPMQSYISLNIDGISAIVDMMGGVEMSIPEDYTAIDPAFVQGSTLVLNGEQSEKYVRSRDITVLGSNNQRMERQTQFIRAMFSQLKGKVDMDSALVDVLLSGANPYMVTDMDADSMKALSGYDMEENIARVPGEVRAGAEHDEFYVDEDALYELIVNVFYKPVTQS